ncbi:MAG: DUF433 domain-containing protein [Burkholderiaceae bacterium]
MPPEARPSRQRLAEGMTPQEIISDYPDLESEDIRAVLEYAARLSRIRHIDPLAA